MTAYTIPLNAVPAQSEQVHLGGQDCRVAVYQKRTGLYLDVYLGTTPIAVGVLARDRTFCIRGVYQGFSGDLAFIDTQGAEDPDYAGIGTRYFLLWFPV